MMLTPAEIATMLEDKRCPKCHQFVEYHGFEGSMYCEYYRREDELIHYFNLDEFERELRAY